MARKKSLARKKSQSEARYRRAITTADAQRTAARHGLPASTGAVLVALADHSNANRVADGLATVWPKVETIAERVGLSVRMVRYHLAALKRAGLLVDVDHPDRTAGLVDRGRTRVRALVIDMFEAVTKSIAGLAGTGVQTAGRDTSYREDGRETRTASPAPVEQVSWLNPVPASPETRAASMAAIRAAISGRRERARV